MAFAAGGERSPAAIGRYGLLTRSISTSVIWLTPTIETLTARAATSVASRSATDGCPRAAARAITYSPATESAVPMTVCGRLKRHSTSAARTARAGSSAAAATAGGRSTAAMGTNAAPAAEPRTKRAAKRSAAGGRVLGGGGRAAGDGPGAAWCR